MIPEWLQTAEVDARAAWARAGWPPTHGVLRMDASKLEACPEARGQRLVQRARIAAHVCGETPLPSQVPGVRYGAMPFQDTVLFVAELQVVGVAVAEGHLWLTPELRARVRWPMVLLLGDCSPLEALARTLCVRLPEELVGSEGLIPWEAAPVHTSSGILWHRLRRARARDRDRAQST